MLKRFYYVFLIQLKWFFKKRLKREEAHFPKPLVLNLTSFPARFKTLHLTLKTLLLQRVKPQHVVLWLFEDDIQLLPKSVLSLKARGLEIKGVPVDTRSYKKLIPALEQWPDAFHITVDDDVYYPSDLVQGFQQAYQGNDKEILCYRANYIAIDSNNKIKPYLEWTFISSLAGPESRLLFTGVGGVFYPPGCLDSRVLTDDYLSLAPHSDDLWFYWMALMNGCTIKRIGQNIKGVTWKGTQRVSLWRTANNLQEGNANDLAIQKLVKEYGQPF